MIEFTKFLMRNPSEVTKSVRRNWAIGRACKDHKVGQPDCQWCHSLKHPEAHHIVPVSVCPERACDVTNLITLCRKCHRTVGHCGDFTNRYVVNVVQVCNSKQVVKTIKYRRDEDEPISSDASCVNVPGCN